MEDVEDIKVREVTYDEVMKVVKTDPSYWVNENAVHLALEVDGRIVSYISYFTSKYVWHCAFAYTFEEFRSKGYGSRFLKYIEKLVLAKYPLIKRAKVCALAAAVQFYSRIGFVPVKNKEYSFGLVVYMEKKY